MDVSKYFKSFLLESKIRNEERQRLKENDKIVRVNEHNHSLKLQHSIFQEEYSISEESNATGSIEDSYTEKELEHSNLSLELPKEKCNPNERQEITCSNNVIDYIDNITSHAEDYPTIPIKKQAGEKPYKCSYCDKAFKQKRCLKEHIKIHTGEKPFLCNQCGKSFSQSSILVCHMRTHTGERPYQCNECGKTFAQNSQYHRHMRIHTGEKPYKCSLCDKSFSDNAYLIKHMRSHTGEKPYPCSQCDKAFSQKSSYNLHMRIHSGLKPHKCCQCGKAFSRNSHLVSHMRTHSGERPHQCSLCDMAFSNNNDLISHMMNHSITVTSAPTLNHDSMHMNSLPLNSAQSTFT